MSGITQVEVSAMMLHNESRELVVEAYEKTHDAKRVSEDFGICERTVYKLVTQSFTECQTTI